MKSFKSLLIALVALPFFSLGQIKTVRFQAAGLTCSMCSNAINKALKTLPAVSSVETDLETNTFIVSFKNATTASFDDLKNKVEGAGFSISKMQVEMDVANLAVANDTHTEIAGKQFHFVRVKDGKLNGTKVFTLVDKGFLPAKQFKVYEAATPMACIKTGRMAACCKGGGAGERIYHVTI